MTTAEKASIRARVVALVTDPETRGHKVATIAARAGCSLATVSRIERELRAAGHPIPRRPNLGRPPVAKPKRPLLLNKAQRTEAAARLVAFLESDPEALEMDDAAIGRRFRLSPQRVLRAWQEIFDRRDAQLEVAGG